MKEKGKNENLTKLKGYLAKGAYLLRERLNYGGEVIALPHGRERKKIDTKKLTLLGGSFLLSFILARGRMAFDTYPLALALAASATSLTPTLALGALFGSLTLEGGMAYVIAYLLLLALRFILAYWYVKPTDAGIISRLQAALGAAFSESLYVRMALSLPPAFLSGVYTLAARGFYFHDVAGLLFLTVFTPAAVFVFSGAFDKTKNETYFKRTALCAILFSAVFSLHDVSFFGISLQVAAAFFIIMYAAHTMGPVVSALSGALAGLAISPVHAPLFAISGISAGALAQNAFPIMATAALSLTAGLGFFLIGPSVLITTLPSALLGCVLFSLAKAAGILTPPTSLVKNRTKAKAEPITERKHRALRDDMSELCEAFSALSDIFMNISNHVRVPSVAEFKDICDSTCDKYCAYCSYRSVCWEREYGSSADMITKLSDELHRLGRASERYLPEQIKARCAALGDILEEINVRAARAIEASLSRDRAEVVGCDFASFSAIISEALASNEEDFMLDEGECKRLLEEFSREGDAFPLENLLVWGRRQKHVRLLGVGSAALRVGRSELKRKLERICSYSINSPELEICDSGINISFDVEPSYMLETSHTVISALSDACGDNVASFSAPRAFSYLMISDGMGTGKLAALSSGLCSVFMERMLGSGMRAESAMKMLSALLRAKGIECSSSLDIAEFDLISGRVSFLKSGAAPSFVLRGGNLFRIEAKTAPIGIMRTLDAEQIKFELAEGDVIIMLSDGVCEDFESCAWLPTLLVDEWESDLSAMSDKIAREAAVRCRTKDDISVAIARVGKRK